MTTVWIFALISACVIIHAVGMWLGVGVLAAANRRATARHKPRTLARAFVILAIASCWLVVLHLLHILLWAGFYQYHQLMADMETAFYFSATSYTTLGYGDVILTGSWRLLGPLEAVTGVLMFGWSTGALFLLSSCLLALFIRHDPTNP
jgi:hypothetical protein